MKRCEDCGAHLDACEVCDCKKEKPPRSGHFEGGKQKNTQISITRDGV